MPVTKIRIPADLSFLHSFINIVIFME